MRRIPLHQLGETEAAHYRRCGIFRQAVAMLLAAMMPSSGLPRNVEPLAAPDAKQVYWSTLSQPDRRGSSAEMLETRAVSRPEVSGSAKSAVKPLAPAFSSPAVPLPAPTAAKNGIAKVPARAGGQATANTP